MTVPHPGTFIKAELEKRGWTQADLALIAGRPQRLISELVNGKRGLTPQTIKELSAVFGDDERVWVDRDVKYRLSCVKTTEREMRDICKRRVQIEKKYRLRTFCVMLLLAGSHA